MFIENRQDPREPVTLPMRVEGSPALARNVSASGMYIEWFGPDPLGSVVHLEMDIVEAGMRLAAQGEIVRIDHSDGKTGLGVRLREPKLEPIPF